MRILPALLPALAALWLGAPVVASRSLAGDGPPAIVPSVGKAPASETWAGADGMPRIWSAYLGSVAALGGSIRDDGWRVRASAAYSQSDYTRSYWDSALKEDRRIDFRSYRKTVDLMVGYHRQLGSVTLKVFAGAVLESKLDAAGKGAPIALDDENGFQGERYGPKLIVETWTRLSDLGFLQADASWSQPLDSFSSRLRLGWRLGEALSLGPELSVYGHSAGIDESGRVGAFARLEWASGEISVSTGMAGNLDRTEGPYGSVNALLRF
ncbi:MAG: cellulose biosynthesis protein BcsS [Hyphomicrobiaceae bacterium]